MKKISCNIIRDILPLYLDDVVCDDTKEMVEEHLQSCSSCREEAASIKKDVILPASRDQRFSEAAVLKKIRNRISRKKMIAVLCTALAVLAAAVGGYALLTLPKSIIPYNPGEIRVEEVTVGGSEYLYLSCIAPEQDGNVSHAPMTIQTDEGEKTVVIAYYYSTPWSRYAGEHSGDDGSEVLTVLGSADEIDEVYYGEFEPVEEFYEDPSAVLDEAELIWRAQEE